MDWTLLPLVTEKFPRQLDVIWKGQEKNFLHSIIASWFKGVHLWHASSNHFYWLALDRQMHREARQMDETYPTFVSNFKTYHSIRNVLTLIISVYPLPSLRRRCLVSLSQSQKGEKICMSLGSKLQFFIFDLSIHWIPCKS